MVLLSESASTAVLSFVFSVFSEDFGVHIFVKSHDKQAPRCGHRSAVLLFTYYAVRLHLETETRQTVGPLFLGVVLLHCQDMRRGKRTKRDWYLTISFIFLMFGTFTVYFWLIGLEDVVNHANAKRLDREMKWYQVIFASFSSYRHFLVTTMALAQPSSSKKMTTRLQIISWIWFLSRIVLLWVVVKFTGTIVTPTPWGALDETLLESTNLLHLVLVVVSIGMFIDQVSYHLSGKDMDYLDWDDFKDHASTARRKFVDGLCLFRIGNSTKILLFESRRAQEEICDEENGNDCSGDEESNDHQSRLELPS